MYLVTKSSDSINTICNKNLNASSGLCFINSFEIIILSMKKITAKQVYDLWATEIECLTFFDLRGKSNYESARIPGALSKCTSELKNIIVNNNQDQLYILILDCSRKMYVYISDLILYYDNFFILRGGMESWTSKSYPTAPLAYIDVSNKSERK